MIKLIVGLGNPGPEYANTRHNAGAWFVQQIAEQYHGALVPDAKFFGYSTRIRIDGQEIHLLVPTTFMNRSGQSISAIAQYFKILPEAILVAHDELDLPPGTIRLKFDGGHGGHNGLRDILSALGTANFYRLRIGIGHPGHKDAVTDYVLHQPSKQDNELIDTAIDDGLQVLPLIVAGQFEKAMQQLHSTNLSSRA